MSESGAVAVRPLRSIRSTSPAGLTSPFQPNQSALRVRTILARTTATPPALALLLRSSTRLETRTTRLIILCSFGCQCLLSFCADQQDGPPSAEGRRNGACGPDAATAAADTGSSSLAYCEIWRVA